MKTIKVVFKDTQTDTYFSGADDKWINDKVTKEIYINGVERDTIKVIKGYLTFNSDVEGKYKIPIENILYYVVEE